MSTLINDGIPDYPQASTIAHYSSTATKGNYSFAIMLGGMVTTNQIQKSAILTSDLSGSYDIMVGRPLLD